jgi:cytochrome c oxidase assembly factor CtaG
MPSENLLASILTHHAPTFAGDTSAHAGFPLGSVSDLATLIVLAAAAAIYGVGWVRWRIERKAEGHKRRAFAYGAGIAAIAIALLGPPDWWNGAFFTAHMAQHILLTLVAPPLLVLGAPHRVALAILRPRLRSQVMRVAVRDSVLGRASKLLMAPLLTVLLANGTLLAWHAPALYTAALEDELLHALEHASMFWTAALFWWVVIAPPPQVRRRSTSAALLMLFATWMVSDLLGATLTLATSVLYAGHGVGAAPGDALADQRWGGLLMWVGGGILYAVCMLCMLVVPYLRQRPATALTPRAVSTPEWRASTADLAPSIAPRE